MKIILRELELKDINKYLKLTHPEKKFHDFNGPYFKRRTEEELKKYINKLKEKLINNETNVLVNKKLIINSNDEIIGEVNWYWKSEETLWMEVGVVIFNEDNWGKGIGYIALKKWVDKIFLLNPKIVRLGITTWSGNIGMIKLAEKLGFKKEAVYRKARIIKGEYFDSISYGILREERE